jgi:alkaline phosphatase D
VTEVTSRSALVWHRARRRGRVKVEYSADARFTSVGSTAAVDAPGDRDSTVVVELTGLDPGREYFYRGVAVKGDGSGTAGPVGRFRTAPESAQPFTFAFSGDMEAGHQPFTLFERIAEKDPHFFILLGDTMYSDVPRERFAPTLAHYRFKHRENRDDRRLQGFLARCAVFPMWDDHEVQNDFNRTHTSIALGRQAFREYWPVRTTEESILYRRFAWGPAADFFIMDCRQYRAPQDDPDGPSKTMLGDVQKAWLKEGLRTSRAPFKFLVSSVPFLGAWGRDKWNGYASERDELRRFLAAERITGVVVLSADVHTAMDLSRGGIREITAGPIAAWPLCRTPDIRLRLAATGVFHLCDAFNYALLTVSPGDPPEVEVQILDATNTVRHRATFPAGTPVTA